VCAWWDEQAQAYSSDGCISLPSPLPSGVTALFNLSKYNASSSGSPSANLLRALQLSGSFFAGCSASILDCPTLGSAGVQYLNEDAPFSAPAVRCHAASNGSFVGSGGLYSPSGSPALLIFHGAKCAAWQAGNAARCAWSAELQAFVGSGCVMLRSSNQTCACTHLTNFAYLSPPNVLVATPEQLAQVPSLDLRTKARTCASLASALFGWMHLQGLLVAVLDRRRRARAVKELFSDAMGFREQKHVSSTRSIWTWRLEQRQENGIVSGPAVRFAAAVGLPLSRLRFSLPEELLDFEGGSVGGDDRASLRTSTALVFALIRNRLLLEREEVIIRQAEARLQFDSGDGGSTMPRRTEEIPFDVLVGLFCEMFASQTLSRPGLWLSCARLWRLILLRRTDAGLDGGGWDPTPGLASVLFATLAPLPAEEGESSIDEAQHHPLDFSAQALSDSCPDYLFVAFATPDGSPTLALRVWTTLLCSDVLERLDVHWVMPSRDGGMQGDITLLEDADAWILRAMRAVPSESGLPGTSRPKAISAQMRLRSSPMDAEIMEAARADARAQTESWKGTHARRISAFKALARLNVDIHGGRQRFAQLCGLMTRRHDVTSSLFQPMSEGLTRVHRTAMLMSTLMGLFVVNTWFSWTRSQVCCSELRALLHCPADITLPCRGFSGDCVDLSGQFAELVIGGSGRVGDFTSNLHCAAFPDPQSNRDTALTGLIAAACAIPLRWVVGVLLKMSCEPEHSNSWLFINPLVHTILRTLGLSSLGASWRWRTARPFWLVRYSLRFSLEPFRPLLERMVDALACCGSGGAGRSSGLTAFRYSRGELASQRAQIAESMRSAQRARAAAVAGCVLIYVAWALLTFFCVVYGALVYGLMGATAEQHFVSTWAVSTGISQAWQGRAVLWAFAMGLLGNIADVLGFLQSHRWLEVYLDAQSVQAVLPRDASLYAFVRAHVEHHASVGFR
jgi:hypothetical protein